MQHIIRVKAVTAAGDEADDEGECCDGERVGHAESFGDGSPESGADGESALHDEQVHGDGSGTKVRGSAQLGRNVEAGENDDPGCASEEHKRAVGVEFSLDVASGSGDSGV